MAKGKKSSLRIEIDKLTVLDFFHGAGSATTVTPSSTSSPS